MNSPQILISQDEDSPNKNKLFPRTSLFAIVVLVAGFAIGLLISGEILTSFFLGQPANIQDGIVPWSWFGLLGVVILCVSFVTLLAIIGILRKSSWSRRILLVCSILNIFLILAGDYPGLLVGIVMLLYFRTRSSKERLHIFFNSRHAGTIGTSRVRSLTVLASVLILSLLVFSSLVPAFFPGFVNLFGTKVTNNESTLGNFPLVNFASAPSAYTPGWNQFSLWRVHMAYRFNGVIPQILIEPRIFSEQKNSSLTENAQIAANNVSNHPSNQSPSEPLNDISYPALNESGSASQFSVNSPLPIQIPDVHGYGGGIIYDPASGDILIGATSLYSFTNYTCACDNGYTSINDLTNTPADYFFINSSFCGVTGSMAYDAQNGKVYMADQGCGYVYAINGATDTYLGNISVGGGNLGDIVYDPGNGYLYVANSGSGSIDVINPTTEQLVANVSLGGLSPDHLVYDTQNGNIYVNTNNPSYGAVAVIDGQTNTWIANITGPNSLYSGIAYDPSNGLLYAFSYDVDVFYVMDTSTNTVIGNISGISSSGLYDNIIYNPGNGDLYALNTEGNDTLVIDPSTNTIIGDINVCPNLPDGSMCAPNAAAYDPWNGDLYVAQDYDCGACGSGNTTIIPTVVSKLPSEVRFVEEGLPQNPDGTLSGSWNLTLSSGPSSFGSRSSGSNNLVHSDTVWSNANTPTVHGNGSSISILLPGNYTYEYSVPEIFKESTLYTQPSYPAAYLPVPNAQEGYLAKSGIAALGQSMYLSGNVSLSGSGGTVPIEFSKLWTLTFPSPPAQGSEWTVTLENCTLARLPAGTSEYCASPLAQSHTAGTPIIFLEMDGVYNFTIRAAGFAPSPDTGQIKISGGNWKAQISYLRLQVSTGLVSAFGDVFSADKQANTVDVYSAASQQLLGQISVGQVPVAVAAVVVGPLNLVFSVNQGSNDVSMIDSATGIVMQNINVGSSPVGIAVDQESRSSAYIFVTNFYSLDISLISLSYSGGNVAVNVADFKLQDRPTGAAFDASSNNLYVSLFDSKVVQIFNFKGTNLVPQGYITVGLRPMGMGEDGSKNLFVANAGDNTVSFIQSQNVAGSYVAPESSATSIAINVGACPDCRGPEVVTLDATNTGFVLYGNGSSESLAEFDAAQYTGQSLGYLHLQPSGEFGFTPISIGTLNSTTLVVSGADCGVNNIVTVSPKCGLYDVQTFPVTFQLCGGIGISGQGCTSFPYTFSLNGNVFGSSSSFPITIYLTGGTSANNYGQNIMPELKLAPQAGYLLQSVQFSSSISYVNYTQYYNYNGTYFIEGINGPGTVQINIEKIVIPNQWEQSPYFQVSESSISGQAIAGGVAAGCVLTGTTCGLVPATAGLVGASQQLNMYSISQAAGASYSAYNYSLTYFFNIIVPSGYANASVELVDIPLTSWINSQLSFIPNFNLPENNSGQPWSFGLPTCVGNICMPIGYGLNFTLTQSGHLVLALITSQVAKVNSVTVFEDLTKFATAIAAVSLKDKATKIVSAIGNIISVLNDFTDFGMAVMRSDVGSAGKLGGYGVIDLTQINTIFKLISASSLVSFVSAIVGLFSHGTSLLVSVLLGCVPPGCPDSDLKVVQSLWDAINVVIQGLGLVTSIGSGSAYKAIASVSTSLTNLIDPNGTTIIPSYYNSTGSLVLGYDPATQEIVKYSSSGFLLSTGESYYAYFYNESQGSIQNYTEVLNTIGPSNVSVPYTVEYFSPNSSAGGVAYSGELRKGVNAQFDLNMTSDGTPVTQTYLTPRITVAGSGGNYTVYVTPYLSNGTLTTAASVSLTLNGTDYQMNRVNDSLFSLSLQHYSQTQTLFTIQALSDEVAGGFNASVLPAAGYSITFSESGLPSGTHWSVNVNGTSDSTTSSTIVFNVPTNGTYAYSIGVVSGYIASAESGTINVNSGNVLQSVTFTTISTSSASSSHSAANANSSPLSGLVVIAVIIAIVACSSLFLLWKRKKKI